MLYMYIFCGVFYRGEDGEQVTTTTFVTSRGQSLRNGINQKTMAATYIWRKVINKVSIFRYINAYIKNLQK